MRSLSTALTAAQKALGAVLVKAALTRTGQTTQAFALDTATPDSNVRFLQLQHDEADYSHTALILLQAASISGAANWEGYQAFISYGYATGASRTAWAANTAYVVDDIRVPTTANGYQYRCSVAGTSHATTEPTWPATLGATVVDQGVTWEMDGNSGDEYSRTAPLIVKGQQLYFEPTVQVCQLECYGIPDQLDDDKASQDYRALETNTDTVKTLINKICSGTLGTIVDSGIDTNEPLDSSEVGIDCDADATSAIPVGTIAQIDEEMMLVSATGTTLTVSRGYGGTTAATHSTNADIYRSDQLVFSHCTALTVSWDSEDSLIDSYKPADTFRLYGGDSRLKAISELLATTKCVAVFKPDGKMHIINPTVTGGVYAYSYDNTIAAGNHTFFRNAFRSRIVIPNKITVKSRPGDTTIYSGSATESTSYGLLPKDAFILTRLTSNQEGTDLATAMIQRLRTNAETGEATVPMNVGQEVHDYVNVNSESQGIDGSGNVRKITRRYAPGERFEMTIALGDQPPMGFLQSISTFPLGFRPTEETLRVREELRYQREWLNGWRGDAEELRRALTERDLIPEIIAQAAKVVYITVIANDTALTTGDGKHTTTIGWDLNGMYLLRAHATVYGASPGTGTPAIQIRNVTDSVDMLSTPITIDTNEYGSYTAAIPPVIDKANNQVAAGDRIAIDVDDAGTSRTGLDVVLTFGRPQIS